MLYCGFCARLPVSQHLLVVHPAKITRGFLIWHKCWKHQLSFISPSSNLRLPLRLPSSPLATRSVCDTRFKPVGFSSPALRPRCWAAAAACFSFFRSFFDSSGFFFTSTYPRSASLLSPNEERGAGSSKLLVVSSNEAQTVVNGSQTCRRGHRLIWLCALCGSV